MNDAIENLPHPLGRFYLRRHGWMWAAHKHSPDHHPDALLGIFFTRDMAMRKIQDTEECERESLGVWRFFAE